MLKKMTQVALGALSVASLVGCDQLTATVQAVGILTRTPEIADTIEDEQLEAALLDQLNAQRATAVFLGLGERESPTSTAAPTPITGAKVVVRWSAGEQIELCEVSEQAEGNNSADGTYGAASIPAENNTQIPKELAGCVRETLDYVVDNTYTMEIETLSDSYHVQVDAPPAIAEGNVDFEPALAANAGLPQIKTHSLNADLTVDWTRDATDRPAFVTLVRINFTGNGSDPTAYYDANNWQAEQQPVYENLPKKPEEMIKLITEAPKTSATIPGAKFDQPGLYMLMLTATEISTQTSTNLALGSGALAGYGTAFVFLVK